MIATDFSPLIRTFISPSFDTPLASQAENASSILVARSKDFALKPFDYKGLNVIISDRE